MHLTMLMIVAPNLAVAKAFYGTALGFVLRSETPSRLVFVHPGAELVIFKGNAPAPPSRHGQTAATVFVFAAPDLDAAMTMLQAKGVQFLHTVPAAGEFGRYAAFRDPFGNVLELLERA